MMAHQFEVFDLEDDYGMAAPSLTFEATSWREAYEVAFQSYGMRLVKLKEERGE